MSEKKYLVIAGGGLGVRMNSVIPKQFICLAGGLPVLFHTFHAFVAFDPKIRIILSLPEKYFSYWKKLCKKYRFSIPHELIPGGRTRFHSVQNALRLVNEHSIVAIHDAVRPFVSRMTISRTFKCAAKHGASVPVIGVNESVRIIDKKRSKPFDRKKIAIVQTPQCFRAEVIRMAYEQKFRKSFTDDASVAEAAGFKIHLVDGNLENIKITSASDLQWSEFYIRERENSLNFAKH